MILFRFYADCGTYFQVSKLYMVLHQNLAKFNLKFSNHQIGRNVGTRRAPPKIHDYRKWSPSDRRQSSLNYVRSHTAEHQHARNSGEFQAVLQEQQNRRQY